MNPWAVPWLDWSVAVPLIGALWVSRYRDPTRAFHWGLFFTGATLACALLTWAGFAAAGSPGTGPDGGVGVRLFGKPVFGVDGLSAPLVAVVALLHFLTALATPRTKMRRFSLSWSLAYEALRLATFGARDPGVIVALLVAGTVVPAVELGNRGQSLRVYALHMGLFVVLLLTGWSLVDPAAGNETQTAWATVPLLAAVLVRSGVVPAHCWLTDWFEQASFGNALLFVAPLTGVYAAVRLVLPIAPDWVLQGLGIFSLVTAVYAAGMATVQLDARRFFAYLFLSHASLVLVGLELVTPISLTGALSLWLSVPLSLGGLGLTLRAVEARFGRLSLASFHGLYDHAPTLAVCFLLTGLASVGFPVTLGFVATELLVDGAVGADLSIGVAVVVAAALNGIAVVRAYLVLFTGARHASTVSLNIGPRERFAVLTLAALILLGGVFPQVSARSRFDAAKAILNDRAAKAVDKSP
jgi:NADH-quinone oxidoreductase subunit M